MKLILNILFLLLFSSCTKQFLEKKPSSSLIIPQSLKEFQALMDDYSTMNETGALGEVSSDDYYLNSQPEWQALAVQFRNAYVWSADIYEGIGKIPDWNNLYKQVFNANIVLEGLNNIQVTSGNKSDWNRIKGWALFLRGFAFYNLAQHFSLPYDKSTSDADLGIPIRLKPEIDVLSTRSSVSETYRQIISDVTMASQLLPNQSPGTDRNRPYKPAAMALLSRVYLSMRDYEKAFHYADSSLQLYNVLGDYNQLSASNPFLTRTYVEVLYQASLSIASSNPVIQYKTFTIIDSTLYSSYAANDLRKSIYFRLIPASNKPSIAFSTYSGTINGFSGLATDEMYLTRAECYARAGNTAAALTDLNALLVKRWKNTALYNQVTATSSADALNKILIERRKELCFRGLRWMDLRRLNKDGANITLKRNLNGQLFYLTPNSPLYALPIPEDEIANSGIQQNPR
jgi:starch-binding outer membrane protein, SusD/RagB family